jgi:hypothetical protein
MSIEKIRVVSKNSKDIWMTANLKDQMLTIELFTSEDILNMTSSELYNILPVPVRNKVSIELSSNDVTLNVAMCKIEED